jgi:RNA polymerase sigma factor (sigma-70 family)
MEKNVDYAELVKRAQEGDQESLGRLTGLAEERLRVDIYRLTLRDDLTQEVVQESLFEMFKVLGDLKEANKFWPWLYKIALNKIRLHYRKEQRRKAVTASVAADAGMHRNDQEVMAGAISRELKQIVLSAIRHLKPRQRAVLTMRCYREMEYSQIGESIGCSEFAAKMLFYRAKKSLRKELSRYGFGKGMFLTALIIFGKITAPSEAAATGLTVTAATTKVGVAAGLAAFATSKSGILSLTAAGALAVGTAVVATSLPDQTKPAGVERSATGLYPAGQISLARKGLEEYWYYYPSNASEHLMMRLVKLDSSSKQPYCQWLQNKQANYWFDKRRNTVHIKNHRRWNSDLSVWRLPTDEAQMQEFIGTIEGGTADFEYVRRSGDGLVVIVGRDDEGKHSQVTHHYNASDEQYFLYDWAAGARVLDDRDAMHKRGWTYFRVSGHIGGREVTGTGRIPFVYAAARWNYPWLRLKIAGGPAIIDNYAQARVYDASGRMAAQYGGGSFFAGLGRPWVGLHTADTVRRDAGRQQVWFETKRGAEEGKVEVTLKCRDARLTYLIDMETDVIEKITYSGDDGGSGQLEFSYLQEVEGANAEFVPPRTEGRRRASGAEPGMLWLVDLMSGGLQ